MPQQEAASTIPGSKCFNSGAAINLQRRPRAGLPLVSFDSESALTCGAILDAFGATSDTDFGPFVVRDDLWCSRRGEVMDSSSSAPARGATDLNREVELELLRVSWPV